MAVGPDSPVGMWPDAVWRIVQDTYEAAIAEGHTTGYQEARADQAGAVRDDVKSFGAALVDSDLWPPGPSMTEKDAARQAAYDRAPDHNGLTYDQRQAQVYDSWGLDYPGLEAEHDGPELEATA